MYKKTIELITLIKEKKPLILNCTNMVTMDFIANGLLSLGASPIMSLAHEELADLISLAHALVVNIGTLNNDFIALSQQAGLLAKQLQKPLIFDPVGAGASQLRTQFCLDFLKAYPVSIIRGNASEILALAGEKNTTKGVDSRDATDAAIDAALYLTNLYSATIVISGEVDRVVQQNQISDIQGGSSLMPQITGSGCLLTAVIAAFFAVEADPFIAANTAAKFYKYCGEQAAIKAQTPASFKLHFLDALYELPSEQAYASL